MSDANALSNLEPYFKKGERHLCVACGDLLYIITRDCFSGERFSEAMIVGGQNFAHLERMTCKKCGHGFHPIKSTVKIE